MAIEKSLSNNIMRLNKENLSLFLNRLFSCDGSIYYSDNKWNISYSSSSEKMIRQIQSLLLRFGILSKLRNKIVKCNDKIFNSFELVLSSVNVVNFIKEIGFYGEKEIKAKLALEELDFKKFNPNVDTIPKEIWETYKPISWTKIGRSVGYAHPKAMRERVNYAPSRQTLLQIAEVENNNPLRLLAMSDIFWDEIVSMEILDGKFKVYDICVPENHNFVANDIIVHNSYTIGAIAEALSSMEKEEAQNISPLLFDTMGIFWTMKFKNKKDKALLDEWGLEAKNVDVNVFAPYGYYQDYRDKGIPVDSEFAIKISELEADDWISLFELNFIAPEAVLIEQKIFHKM